MIYRLGVLGLALAAAGVGAQEPADPVLDSPGKLPEQIAASPAPPPTETEKRLQKRKQPAPKSSRKLPPLNASLVQGLFHIEKQGTGVYYRKGFVLNVGVHVIEADLSDPNVKIAAMVSRHGIGTSERFGQMVARARPAAAITGTFFGVKNHIPTGDLVINGRPVFRGFIGTAVAITEGNVASFITTRYKDQSVDWSMYETVIRGGPRLVDSGSLCVAARKEGFKSLPISQRRTRTAVGLTRDNHLQFVAVRQGITLYELAKVMRAIGAYHAVALDGGSSTAMYFAGRYIARPSRGLTNLMLIYHRPDQFEAKRHQLAGPRRPSGPLTPPSLLPQPAAPAPESLQMGELPGSPGGSLP
ncbi:MAG: phosphodiester glycosidase family protein [Armatimonadota bacterium]